MGLIEFKQIKGAQVITDEGFFLGNVFDMKYNQETWKVKGMRMSQTARFKKLYPTISGKAIIAPSTKYVIGDVILTNMSSEELKGKIATDPSELDLVSGLYGMKVFAAHDFYVGNIESVKVDIDNWHILTFNVKLDKEAHKPLGVKKVLFSKTISGVQTDFVASIGDTIKLKLTIDELKKEIMIDE